MARLDMMLNGQLFSYNGESDETLKECRDLFMKAAESDVKAPEIPKGFPKGHRILSSKVKRLIGGNIDDIISEITSGNLLLNVGDSIQCLLTTGQNVTFEVTDVDDVGYRLEMKELLETMPHTDVREWYDKFYNSMLPDSLREAIIPTRRVYKKNGNGDLVELHAKIFMPSASEVFSEEEFEENSWLGDKGVYKQLDFYKDWRNRIRCTVEDGKPNAWWLLSADAGNSAGFAYVSLSGNCNTGDATLTWVAAPVCFRIRKSR